MTDGAYTTTLTEPLALTMTSNDDGDLRIQLTNDESGNVYYSVVRASDWFTSPQKRREVVNAAVDNVPQTFDGETVRDELERVVSKFDANNEEVRRETRPEGVEQVLSSTTEVTATRGEQTEFQVTVDHNGHEATLTFTAGEWATNSPHPLIEQWTAAFLSRPEGVTADRWEEIRTEWEDQLTRVTETGATHAEIVADTVVKEIRKTGLPAVANKESLANDENATLYDDGGQIPRSDFSADAVLWVHSGLVMDKLADAGESTDYANQLSIQLQEDGQLHAPTERHRLADGGQYMLYPFDPDALGVDAEADVVDRTVDFDDEVEP